MQYGEVFEKLGVPGMGRLGAPWAAIDPAGVLVVMAHQNFFVLDKATRKYVYVHPAVPKLNEVGGSIAQSLKVVEAYYEPGKPILLPIAEFSFDGGLDATGKIKKANFLRGTGSAYRATMREFDPFTGRNVCDVVSKFDL
jgi:hypothetical protein